MRSDLPQIYDVTLWSLSSSRGQVVGEIKANLAGNILCELPRDVTPVTRWVQVGCNEMSVGDARREKDKTSLTSSNNFVIHQCKPVKPHVCDGSRVGKG